MSHAVSLINGFAAAWADAFARACWQGGLGIALIWLFCRLWPALPAGPRCWLWRLAYAKLLLGLLWLPPLVLPLLPAPKQPAPPSVAQAAAPPVQALPDDAPLVATELPPPPSAAPSIPLAAPPPPPAAAPLPPPATTPPLPLRPTLPTVQTWLLAAWMLGVFASLGRVASAWRRACALFRTSKRLADEALQADAADLSRRLGLRRVPPLHVADGLASPLLLGLGRPTILLPTFVVSGSLRPELRLMLAHELAHLARRDLWWNALPLLAQRLFFFHPLVWLAGHEWALAQEIACDALAVQTAGTPPSAYARMLLGIATRRRMSAAPLFPTLAVAAPRHTLRRRLHAMQHIGTVSRPRLILAAALTALLAVGGLVPWRVVAQSRASVSDLPAAMRAEEARQVKERTDYAAWEAQADAQFAAALGHVRPARRKEAQARIAPMEDYVAKSQKHTLMMEQHRADYIATHPYRLSNAQRNDITRLLYLNSGRSGLNQSVAMDRILRVKLLTDVADAKDAASKESYRAQIERDDSRRRAAEQGMRLLEPRIARQKAVVALIPQDQRTLVDKLRQYDIEIWGGRIEALVIKRSRMQVLHQLLANKPPRHHPGTTTGASFAPPQARAASFSGVAIGEPPALRLAQSEAPLSTPPADTEKEEEHQVNERAYYAPRNAQADKQLAQLDALFPRILEHLSVGQQRISRAEIALRIAEVAKSQQHVQMLEQHRAAYLATHPNRLSDAQVALVQKVNWDKGALGRSSRYVMWAQGIERKLQAHLEAARSTHSRKSWQRQVAAIEQRRQEAERQTRELGPAIAREEAEVAAIPADQRARVAKLYDYDAELSGYRSISLMDKQARVSVMQQLFVLAGRPYPRHRSQGTTTKAALLPPQTKTASFNAVSSGGSPALRLAQSVVASPPVPAGVAYTEAKWEEQERKQQADLDAKNVQADTEIAELQRHLSPRQLKVVQP